MPSLRSAAVLTAASLAALALAACGPKTAATDSAEGSSSAQGSSVLAQLVSDATGSLQKSIDTTSKSTSVTITMTGTMGGEQTDAHGAMQLGKPLKAEITVDDPTQGPTTVKIIGATFYVGIPESERASMDGKKWMKMDLKALGAGSAELARQFDDIDPAKGVKTFLAGKDVTVVGKETIDGVQTVHYATTAPADAYLGQYDTDLRKKAEEQLSKAGVTEIEMDLWVDEKYQLRRMHMVMGSMSDFTIDYTDYGKPVTIETPPAEETVDFNEMLGQLKDLMPQN